MNAERRDAIVRAAAAPAIRHARLPPVLDDAFRPMFLAAGGWAMIALPLWLGMFFGYADLPSRFDPAAWHVHEMLFGVVMAAVSGFLLTAIPDWTGRRPLRGLRLAALAGLWLLGRLASLLSADMPAWLAIVADLTFPTALLAVVAREIIAGRNWRNLPLTAPLALLIGADLLMHLEALGVAVPPGLGWRLAVAALLLLIAVIGGRIIPSFTRNWMSKRNEPRLPGPQNMVDTAAVGAVAAGLMLWAFRPENRVVGALLIFAALLNGVRLGRWRGSAARAEKLLLILHAGYAWLVLGVLLLGLSILRIAVPFAAAVHALTAGAIAVMILAVMPRVTLGHTGRTLTANRAAVVVFVLINTAAIARIGASWLTAAATTLLLIAGLCWVLAFGLFVFVYGPMLLARRPAS